MKDLEEIEKKNPFKVPEGYFESLSDRIVSATAGVEPAGEKKPVVRRLKTYLRAAAAIAMLAVLSYTVYYFAGRESYTSKQNEISFNGFYGNYLNDIDLMTLEESIIDSGSFRSFTEVESDDIIDYLISQNIDIFDIYELL